MLEVCFKWNTRTLINKRITYLKKRRETSSFLLYEVCFKWNNRILINKHITYFFLKRNIVQVSKGSKIRNRYNQEPHLTHDTNGKVTNSQLDTTNEGHEVSPFPAGDHKAHINRRAQRHSKHKTEQNHKRSTNEVPHWNGQ